MGLEPGLGFEVDEGASPLRCASRSVGSASGRGCAALAQSFLAGTPARPRERSPPVASTKKLVPAGASLAAVPASKAYPPWRRLALLLGPVCGLLPLISRRPGPCRWRLGGWSG